MRQTVTITYRGLELEVVGDYYKGQPGSMYKRNGDPGDPPEPAEFSIDKIYLADTADDYKDDTEMSEFFDGLYHGEGKHCESCYREIEDLCLEEIEGSWYDDDYKGE